VGGRCPDWLRKFGWARGPGLLRLWLRLLAVATILLLLLPTTETNDCGEDKANAGTGGRGQGGEEREREREKGDGVRMQALFRSSGLLCSACCWRRLHALTERPMACGAAGLQSYPKTLKGLSSHAQPRTEASTRPHQNLLVTAWLA
jgi:hypothetical protein